MSRYGQVDLAYEFLINKEKQGEAFTIQQLAEATGWKVETCRTFPSKRWHQYVEKDGDSQTNLIARIKFGSPRRHITRLVALYLE